MIVVYDNSDSVGRADDRFVLEEDDHGRLYETSNANTRALVSGAMVGFSMPSRDGLVEQFGSAAIADRYLAALQDHDK